jgi:hypothetical protein
LEDGSDGETSRRLIQPHAGPPAHGGQAYSTNDLIDVENAIIADVEPTAARPSGRPIVILTGPKVRIAFCGRDGILTLREVFASISSASSDEDLLE